MSDYVIGVDLGTTYSAAAALRDGRLEVEELGERIASVASVLWFRADGRVLVGEAAARRAESEPGRTAREFKRRFGDPVPLMVAGRPMSADALTAQLLRWVIDVVIQREGGEPAGVGVAHPANWGPYKLDLLAQVVSTARVDHAVLVSEPHAAAESHATATRVDVGDVVAVYDLGGGTFDAAVLRRLESGFELVGPAEGIERLGGIDFDEAVFEHVRQVAGARLSSTDHKDPLVAGALLRLREECTRAKEMLSSDTEAVIPVTLPDLHTSVRLTRGEFEDMIRPSVAATTATLTRAVASAGLTPAQVSKVLLVGGSSRIPLVSLMVSRELGRPVALDTHPKHAVAMGSAHLAKRGAPVGAASRSGARPDAVGPPTAEMPLPGPATPHPSGSPPPGPGPPGGSAPGDRERPLSWDQWKSRSPAPASRTRRRSRRRSWLIPAVVLGVLLLGGAIAVGLMVRQPSRDPAQPAAAAAFTSDELRQFAGNLLSAPGASCAPASEAGQREAVDCRWDNGVRGQFFLAADRQTFDDVRSRASDDEGTVPGSFLRDPDGWKSAPPGAPEVRQGEYAQYILERTRSANIYYDQESTLAWGVLWLPSGDQQALRDFWSKRR